MHQQLILYKKKSVSQQHCHIGPSTSFGMCHNLLAYLHSEAFIFFSLPFLALLFYLSQPLILLPPRFISWCLSSKDHFRWPSRTLISNSSLVVQLNRLIQSGYADGLTHLWLQYALLCPSHLVCLRGYLPHFPPQSWPTRTPRLQPKPRCPPHMPPWPCPSLSWGRAAACGRGGRPSPGSCPALCPPSVPAHTPRESCLEGIHTHWMSVTGGGKACEMNILYFQIPHTIGTGYITCVCVCGCEHVCVFLLIFVCQWQWKRDPSSSIARLLSFLWPFARIFYMHCLSCSPARYGPHQGLSSKESARASPGHRAMVSSGRLMEERTYLSTSLSKYQGLEAEH